MAVNARFSAANTGGFYNALIGLFFSKQYGREDMRSNKVLLLHIFDLVRWGEAEEKLNDFYQYEGSLFPDVEGGEFTPNKNEYYPIPQRQIDLSVVNGKAVLQQDTGYN